MEETKPNVLKHVLSYSTIIAILLFTLFLVSYMFNFAQSGAVAGILNFIVQLSIFAYFIYKGMKDYRDKYFEGYLSYGKVLTLGLVLVSISAVIYTIFFGIYIYFDIDYFEYLRNLQFTQLKESGLSDEQIYTYIENSSKFLNPYFMTMGSLIGNIIYGGLISLVIAAVVKKDKPFSI